MTYTYEYPRASTTLDAAVIRVPDLQTPQILLIKRKNEPFADHWALPGGFLEMDEEPVVGAQRELEEETSLHSLPLKPVFTCGQTGRDPRGRCITIVYGCLVKDIQIAAKAGDDASETEWFPLNDLPELAFDHKRIIKQLVDSIKWQAKTSIIGQDVFSDPFSEEEIIKLQSCFISDNQSECIQRGIQQKVLEKKGNNCYTFCRRENSGPDWVERVW